MGSLLMVQFIIQIKATSKDTWLMDWSTGQIVNSFSQKETFLWVNSKEISFSKGLILLREAYNTKDNLGTESSMEEEFLKSKDLWSTMVSSQTMSFTAKAFYKTIKTRVFMKVNFKMAKNLVSGKLEIKRETYMKDNFKTIKNMAKANLLLERDSIEAGSLMGNFKEKACWSIQMETFIRELLDKIKNKGEVCLNLHRIINSTSDNFLMISLRGKAFWHMQMAIDTKATSLKIRSMGKESTSWDKQVKWLRENGNKI